jgi:thioredoxin 1
MMGSMAISSITDAQFEEKVLKSDKPVFVDFWAPWCGPCKMAEPVLEELSGEYEGKVNFYKMNVDEEQKYAGSLGVMSIPTTILFKDGKMVDRQTGFAGKAGFEKILSKS